MPPAIPVDLSEDIIKNHGDPPVWWVGQFVKYIMRPHANLQSHLKDMEDKYGLGSMQQSPIVGLQIRRTDKIFESRFHSVEEYMSHVSSIWMLIFWLQTLILLVLGKKLL